MGSINVAGGSERYAELNGRLLNAKGKSSIVLLDERGTVIVESAVTLCSAVRGGTRLDVCSVFLSDRKFKRASMLKFCFAVGAEDVAIVLSFGSNFISVVIFTTMVAEAK